MPYDGSQIQQEMLLRVVFRNANFKQGFHVEAAMVNRVVSTPSWPVPYYQRIVKAYPIPQDKNVDLTAPDAPISEHDWYNAREALMSTLKGRGIINFTEQHLSLKSYIVFNNDCTQMAKAFTEDLATFLDVANQENKRILKDELI